MQDGMEGNPMAETIKKVSRFFGVMFVPLTLGFPKVCNPTQVFKYGVIFWTNSVWFLKLAIADLDLEF